MAQLLQWLNMGGYSIYIWPAYGFVCVVLVMNILGIKRERVQTRTKLQQWFKKQK